MDAETLWIRALTTRATDLTLRDSGTGLIEQRLARDERPAMHVGVVLEIGHDVRVHRGDVVSARRDRRRGRTEAAGCARARFSPSPYAPLVMKCALYAPLRTARSSLSE